MPIERKYRVDLLIVSVYQCSIGCVVDPNINTHCLAFPCCFLVKGGGDKRQVFSSFC